MHIKSTDDPEAGNDNQQTRYYLGKKKKNSANYDNCVPNRIIFNMDKPKDIIP